MANIHNRKKKKTKEKSTSELTNMILNYNLVEALRVSKLLGILYDWVFRKHDILHFAVWVSKIDSQTDAAHLTRTWKREIFVIYLKRECIPNNN